MIKGILVDLSGTVHIGDRAIPGAVEAVRRLQGEGFPLRFVTNTSRKTRAMLHEDLLRFGFDMPVAHLFTAPLAVRRFLEMNSLRPFLLIHPNLAGEFADLSQQDPNAVVVGFAQHAFTYAAMNRAFQLLKNGAPLLATGKTRYFEGAAGLELDAGPFVDALEYASGTEAVVLGKPSARFFLDAVAELGCRPEETIMVGDDVVSDVRAAVDAGLRGILVQTGKYRQGDEKQISSPEALLARDVCAAVEMIRGEVMRGCHC
ncbi:MAG TPA: TIGR01458 family HAD-type hydrolase [Geobacteraceae bacterium]|nr:TIGR01458 family HAD-type hydrolase [Geobacteraceae bacterium]